jgi:hypothetical protein
MELNILYNNSIQLVYINWSFAIHSELRKNRGLGRKSEISEV